MSRPFEIIASKTYKTAEIAVKAVDKFGYPDDVRYFIMTNTEGRFFPVFVGIDQVMKYGIHFNFNCVG